MYRSRIKLRLSALVKVKNSSYATQADRAHLLDVIANQLQAVRTQAGSDSPLPEADWRSRRGTGAALAGGRAVGTNPQEPDDDVASVGREDRQGGNHRPHQHCVHHS